VYDIPRWVLLPQEEEAVNLLVVASPSASHIGMSTLRMEPQFMIMGQSAGTIAALALKSNGGNVHAVDADEMHARLLQGGQLMGDACGKTPSPPPPAPPAAHNSSYTVKGAGSSDCNGVYSFDPSQSRYARHIARSHYHGLCQSSLTDWTLLI
jgi:hypothetical protein